MTKLPFQCLNLMREPQQLIQAILSSCNNNISNRYQRIMLCRHFHPRLQRIKCSNPQICSINMASLVPWLRTHLKTKQLHSVSNKETYLRINSPKKIRKLPQKRILDTFAALASAPTKKTKNRRNYFMNTNSVIKRTKMTSIFKTTS